MACNFDFVENFWDSDIVGTAGFEALVRRLKDGNNFCEEIEKLLKNRSSAEKDYAVKLSRHSQGVKGRDYDTDGLRLSWDEFVRQSEAESAHHSKSANALQGISKMIEEFRTNQAEQRRRLEDGVKRLQTQKKESYRAVQSSRERYENKCRDADNAEEVYERERHTNAPPAQITKHFQKLDKCRKSSKEADDAYKKSVDQLEAKRKEWEASMVNFCQEAQKLEVERIHFLRNQLWEVTNHVSEKCVAIDEVQETVRKVLEKCNPDNDLQLFVQQKRTGNKRPDTVEYVNYYQDDCLAGGPHMSNGGPTPTGYPNISREPLPTLPTPDYNRREDMGDSIYSSVSDSYLGGNIEGGATNHPPPLQHAFKAKATYQYTAQNTDELSLQPGQTVTVLSNTNSNWWLVEINNQQGSVPSRFLQPIKTPRILI